MEGEKKAQGKYDRDFILEAVKMTEERGSVDGLLPSG
jgi:hypothetical protein